MGITSVHGSRLPQFHNHCPGMSRGSLGIGRKPNHTCLYQVELFGSPFMRNASIILGLLVGCIVAGSTGYMSDS